MDNTVNVLSLCSGYGGLELGLERVFGSIRVLAHVEIEAFAIANLVNKMETGQMVPAPVWTDIKTFRAGLFRGLVDILTGGYPCQPFSAAGKRNGSEDPRHLWPFVRETIRVSEPRWVFLENVEGHLSKGIVQVLSDLEAMAYTPIPGIFSAEEVGAPHQRKRVFILAYSGRSEQRLKQEEFYGGYQLANPRSPQSYGIPEAKEREQDRKTWESGADELAYSSGARRKKRLIESGTHIKTHEPHTRKNAAGNCDLWPARPGEPQYEWEEPRVVADTPQ